MREIKFRVWDTGNKLMYQPALKLMHGRHPKPLENDSVTPRLTNAKNWIWLEYTGLKDKNGKEVYEGDIIDGCKVIFLDGIFGLDMGVAYGSIEFWSLADLFGTLAHRAGIGKLHEEAVQGNIYEHPELLK